MLTAILIGIVLYSLIVFLLLRAWLKINQQKDRKILNIKKISVVVPVRNEEENIENLLNDLINQNYPDDDYEIIVVDDDSDDDTMTIVNRKKLETSNLESIKLAAKKNFNGSFKKVAISTAIKHAHGDIIACTDGDCRLSENWLSSINQAFNETKSDMILGPVILNGQKTIQKFVSVEFSILHSIGVSSLALGIPTFCNGANLAYRKYTFKEVNGYDGNLHLPSGDDEFLMHKIFAKNPDKVHFNKSIEAVASSKAPATWNELINQRIRWASKWPYYENKTSIFLAVITFFFFLSNALLIVLFLAGIIEFKLLLIFFGTKLIVDGIYYKKISKFFRKKTLTDKLIVLEFIYPFFVIFLGFASIFGKYKWKGRAYK